VIEELDGTTFNPLCRPRAPQCTALQTDRRTVGQTDDIITPRIDHTACGTIG